MYHSPRRQHCWTLFDWSNCIWVFFITVPSQRARWRLKSPASRLFTQPFVQTQIKETIKAPRHWPFVWGIHRWSVNSPHKGPVMWKMFPFDDVFMVFSHLVLKYTMVADAGIYIADKDIYTFINRCCVFKAVAQSLIHSISHRFVHLPHYVDIESAHRWWLFSILLDSSLRVLCAASHSLCNSGNRASPKSVCYSCALSMALSLIFWKNLLNKFGDTGSDSVRTSLQLVLSQRFVYLNKGLLTFHSNPISYFSVICCMKTARFYVLSNNQIWS